MTNFEAPTDLNAQLEVEFLKVFATDLQEKHIAAGTVLQEQGVPPPFISLIKTGIVRGVRTGSDGLLVMVGLRSKGWILGAAHILSSTGSASLVTTVTDCVLASVDAQTFRDRIIAGSSINLLLLKMFAEEIVVVRETAHEPLLNPKDSLF